MIQRYNQKLAVCSYCLQPGHGVLRCAKKAQDKAKDGTNGLRVSSSWGGQRKPMKRATKPMRKESLKTKAKRQETSKTWYELNPPDNADGTWNCYLRISPYCARTVTRRTINLEHVKPKQRHPELRYDPTNIKASCNPCNALKWGTELEVLAKKHPHLKQYL